MELINRNKPEAKERKKEYDKKYKEKNYEKIKNYRFNYRYTHKKEYNQYIKIRRKNDELFKLKRKLSDFTRSSFYRTNTKKNKSTEKILGIDAMSLKKYLLETFKTNYGYEWDGKEPVHIDHIIPISKAATSEQVEKLSHFTNLQLLKAIDNQRKSNKLDWELNRN